MERERFLEQQLGRKQPFKVPNGYFEDFAAQMMDKLPEREARIIEMKPRGWRKYRPFAYAAACVCAAIFCVGTYLHSSNGDEMGQTVASVQPKSTYSAIDEVADYTMMDNVDFYAYMSDY
jgi:hypothetical protein